MPAGLGAVAVSEEEQIESSKYTSRPPARPPKHLFDEERFLFPDTYGKNRLRLLVKDPQWLFAYWDVAPTLLTSWRSELGERTMALSRFTLRLFDPGHADDQIILLPTGARSWYVRAERAPRAYSAELGLLLPSGEFRSIARSNGVDTPRVGASPAQASRKVAYPRIQRELAEAPASVPADVPAPRPAGDVSATLSGKRPARKGGASDVFRR